MIREKLAAGVKIILFLVIGVVAFGALQGILVPKYETDKLEQFYALEENSIDVISLGTSHMEVAFSPMDIYEEYGFSSYNLASSGQPVSVSYYLAKEAMEYQSPKVIVLDASNLFFSVNDDVTKWRYVMDAMHYGDSKIEMALDFGERFPEEGTVSALFPLHRYHTRWDELNEEDFITDLNEYYSFGQDMVLNMASPPVDREGMNVLAEREDESYSQTERESGQTIISDEILEHQYSAEISKENEQYLLKLRDLCRENGVELLVTKIPSIQDPEVYNSAWTWTRYDITRSICEKNGIEYMDLLYDATDYIIDYTTDFRDGGYHLSFRGAEKASSYLGMFLQETYHLEHSVNSQYEEKTPLYEKEKQRILLHTELDFWTYMQRLSEYKEENAEIFITGAANMLSGLNDDYKAQLAALGLQTDFNQYTQGAYLAYIKNDTVPYEAYSSLTTSYEYPMEDDEEVYLEATGRENSWYTSITFPFTDEEGNEVNFTRYDSSLTIVVYSPEDEEILDNAYFILNEDGTVSRVWQ